MKKDVMIIGAGLVGSLLALFLSRRGYQVKIYERRPDMRKQQVSAGRSIYLALSDRGLLALERLGIAEQVRNISIPMHGRFIHHTDSTYAFQPYGKEGQFINSVSRTALNEQLIELAEQAGVLFYFQHKCNGINWTENTASFESGPETKTIPFDLLFGADGAFSAARLQHQLHSDRFDYQQSYIDCGYKELTILPNSNGDFAMEVNALHIWPRKDYMLIALPNLDKSFTCTLFFPFEGAASFSKLDSDEKVREFFEKNFPDLLSLMPDYLQDFKRNPVSSLVTVKCFPWIRDEKFTLIGDAAHAIVPFFGQGMNCGFEDCRILDELISEYPNDWSVILPTFQNIRKPDADAIADLAVGNFIEMREKTADPHFLLQKKIEAQLHERYPDRWIPAYSQVTFYPGIRYSDALKRGQRQEQVMKAVMEQQNLEQRFNDPNFYQEIIDRL